MKIEEEEKIMKEKSIKQEEAINEEAGIQEQIIINSIEIEKERMIGAFVEKKEFDEIKKKLKINESDDFLHKEKEMLSLGRKTDEQNEIKDNNINENL